MHATSNYSLFCMKKILFKFSWETQKIKGIHFKCAKRCIFSGFIAWAKRYAFFSYIINFAYIKYMKFICIFICQKMHVSLSIQLINYKHSICSFCWGRIIFLKLSGRKNKINMTLLDSSAKLDKRLLVY